MLAIASVISLVLFQIAIAYSGIPVTFDLYTSRTNNLSMYTNDNVSMTTPYFDACAETIIVITGLSQPRDKPDLIASVEIISGRHYNVIVVHYNTDSYILEVPRTVNKIVEFLEALEREAGANPDRITLIGISLGAHVAGRVGRRYKIGRIIGVDPSGPLYDLMGDNDRLDDSDAKFVDVIHTSNVLGSMRNKIGHVNYIINGGLGQPMCEPLDFYCHHVRGAYLLLASFSVCTIKLRQCFSYWAFKLGLCRSWPTIEFGMALDASKAPKQKGGLYYYDTPSAEFPYCSVEEQKLPKLQPLFC